MSEYIIILIILIIIYYIYNYFYENFMIQPTTPSVNTQLLDVVNQVYKGDIESMRNLSSFSQYLMANNNIILPSNLNINGNIIIGNWIISNNVNSDGTLRLDFKYAETSTNPFVIPLLPYTVFSIYDNGNINLNGSEYYVNNTTSNLNTQLIATMVNDIIGKYNSYNDKITNIGQGKQAIGGILFANGPTIGPSGTGIQMCAGPNYKCNNIV